MNEKYGAGTVKLEIKEQYRNMSEKIRPCYHLIEMQKRQPEEPAWSQSFFRSAAVQTVRA